MNGKIIDFKDKMRDKKFKEYNKYGIDSILQKYLSLIHDKIDNAYVCINGLDYTMVDDEGKDISILDTFTCTGSCITTAERRDDILLTNIFLVAPIRVHIKNFDEMTLLASALLKKVYNENLIIK